MRQYNIKLYFISKENEDTFVYADLGRIIQVVSNPLSNTIQFTGICYSKDEKREMR
jgi:signal transduction histidine kinase